MSSPSSAANGTAIPLPVKPHVDDLFATLFAPTTPPASPLPLGSPSIFSPPPSARCRETSISTAGSTESDFGAFVSVPPSEDPLAALSSNSKPSSPSSPPPRRRLSADFFAEARAATARNQQGLLHELLQHEDDPMYWHNSTASQPASIVPSGTTTPQPQAAAGDIESSDILAPLAKPVKAVVGPLLDALSEATSDNAFSPPPPPAPPPPPVEFVNVTRHRSASYSPPHLRSPSLPPSPSRPTPPVLTRTESMSSTFSTSPQNSRWVSSFLTYRGPPPHHTPSVSPAPTVPVPVPQARLGPKRADITHGSPFASTPFLPASGAPGFDGDRAWNKGFDAEDKSMDAIERRGVQLVGRKESTRGVMGTALANALRSHLPARARLPRTWTLLFSLDQHGISLHTLYTRCGVHTGGALLVVRDAENGCFGAWVADGIREGRGSYIGSGESFLWKAHGEDVRVFKWTGKNDYVALCDPESISFGGGDGHYGLYLDETLYEGSSARCPTFNNDPLCSSSGPGPEGGGSSGTATFECVGLEVWGVAPL